MSGIVPYNPARVRRGAPMGAYTRKQFARYCVGLGALGTSPLVVTGVSKGTSLAAGAGATSLATAIGAGAAAGPIGIVVGAVVGLLTTKLFGHANYAAVYANIANVAQLFQAYTQVAGQYPGRMYGWPELQYIWHGAMVSGLFPGNGPPAGQACTQAMISNKINACGTGQWIDDLLGSSRPTTPGPNNIAALIAKGLSQGIVDPITMTNNVLVPGMEAIAAGKNNGWISVARSANPALYRQLLMDTADYMMSVVNPSMPAYYGPAGVQQPAAPAQSTPTPAQIAPTVASAQSQPVVSAPAPVTVAAPVVSQPTAPVQTVQPVAVAQPPPQSVVTVPVGTTPQGATIIAPATVLPTGEVLPAPAIDSTAAYLAQLQAQGASQNAAMLQAMEALQQQGYSDQAAQSTVAAAAPYANIPPDVSGPATPGAVPVATGSVDNTQLLLIAGGAALLIILMQRRGRR